LFKRVLVIDAGVLEIMIHNAFVHQILLLAAGQQLTVVAAGHAGETVGQNRCARRNDAASFLAGHENQQPHGGDQTDPCRINGDARPLHDIDDRKSFRAASSMAIDDHLNVVDFTGHIDFNDFFADRLGCSGIEAAGQVDDAVVTKSLFFVRYSVWPCVCLLDLDGLTIYAGDH
jgi:hypothetical protein